MAGGDAVVEVYLENKSRCFLASVPAFIELLRGGSSSIGLSSYFFLSAKVDLQRVTRW